MIYFHHKTRKLDVFSFWKREKKNVFPAISVEMMCCGGQYNPTARHTRKVVRNIEFKNRLEREKGLASYNKGWQSKFLLLTSIDVIQHILYKTNQLLIIIISISCQCISVQTLEQIKFSI